MIDAIPDVNDSSDEEMKQSLQPAGSSIIKMEIKWPIHRSTTMDVNFAKGNLQDLKSSPTKRH